MLVYPWCMAARTPFVDDYLPALLARAHLLISSEFHKVAKARGLTVSEWRVLSTLADLDGPMGIGQLMQVTIIKQSTLTVVVDRLVGRGRVMRVSHDSDRRITLVQITPAGRKLVTTLIDLAREHERRVLEPFGLRRAAELKTTLKRLIELHSTESLPGAPQESADAGARAERRPIRGGAKTATRAKPKSGARSGSEAVSRKD